jgi:hypothetical protein
MQENAPIYATARIAALFAGSVRNRDFQVFSGANRGEKTGWRGMSIQALSKKPATIVNTGRLVGRVAAEKQSHSN